jgi:hypothetical protein
MNIDDLATALEIVSSEDGTPFPTTPKKTRPPGVKIPVGERDSTFFKAACSLSRLGASEENIQDTLWNLYANDMEHKPTDREEEVKARIAQKAKRAIGGAAYDVPVVTPGDKPAIGPKAPLFASLATLLANPRPQRWLVKGLIEAPSTVMIFGPSGSGKTFIADDLAGATATGGEWMGRQVSAGRVFFISGEGNKGQLRRFQAWQLKRKVQIPEDRLFLSVVPIELNASGAAEVTAEAERRAQESGEPPALLIVDTLSRAMPAGNDENSVKDMMAFVKAVDQIRDRFNCVAVIVHHAGVADDKRARGSTSLKAAMDAELCVTRRGAIRTAEWTKLKDLPDEPRPREFALESESLGQDEDGNPVTSAVVAWGGETAVQTSKPLTRTENLGLETLRHSITEGYSATLEAWRATFYEKHWGDTFNTKKQAFARIRETLAGRGLIRIDGEHYSIEKGTRNA